MEEEEILDMKKVAKIFNITFTDLIKTGAKQYVEELKRDPFYRLSMFAEDASKEETEEILEEIDKLTDDDLTIETVKHLSVK